MQGENSSVPYPYHTHGLWMINIQYLSIEVMDPQIKRILICECTLFLKYLKFLYEFVFVSYKLILYYTFLVIY